MRMAFLVASLRAPKAMRKKIVAGIAIVAAGVLVFVFAQPEVRAAVLFKWMPRYGRDEHLLRYRDAGGSEVYLLGTIHTSHLDTEEYSLWHLAALIEHLRPAQLLVESRPEEIDQGNPCDGPIEMGFATLFAQSLGIDSRGMDYWRKGSTLGRSDDTRDNEMFARTKPLLHRPGTTLILTGFSHVPEFARRLEADGYRPAPQESGSKTALFSLEGRSHVFPRGMAACVSHRIDHDERELTQESSPDLRKRLEGAVAVRRRLLSLVHAVGEAK